MENTEKFITFTIPIEKEVARTDKNREEIIEKNISYMLQIIEGTRCMANTSNLLNNISEQIHRIKYEVLSWW